MNEGQYADCFFVSEYTEAAAAKCRSGNVVCTVFADKKDGERGRSGIASNIKT